MTPSPRRSLAPKEHGAYAQLALPLLTALCGGRPTWAAVALTMGAVAAFFAHEPLLVVIGRRGGRARAHDGPRAARWLVALSVAAVVLGAVGLYLGGFSVLAAAITPAVGGAVAACLVATDRERSGAGEMVLAACLASVAIPVAVASGWQLRDALSAAIAWSIGLIAATIAVRGILAARKRGTPPSRTASFVVIAPVLAAIAAAVALIPWWTVAASLPLVLVALIVALRPPHPRALMRVGWTLVAATLVTAAAIVAGARLV